MALRWWSSKEPNQRRSDDVGSTGFMPTQPPSVRVTRPDLPLSRQRNVSSTTLAHAAWCGVLARKALPGLVRRPAGRTGCVKTRKPNGGRREGGLPDW